MANHIPKDFIQRVLTQTDIVELIDDYVPLKKAGANYKACCPFHEEKSPSFVVSPQKQIYHCFGCSAGGNAISFLMEYEHWSFVETVEALAKRLNLTVPKTATTFSSPKENTDDLYALMAEATRYYQQQLKQNEAAKNYFIQRGLSGEIAKRFALGYAGDAWEGMLGHLRQKYAVTSMEKTGLIISKAPNKTYDRFRDRVMFPIRDRQGRTIGFGGRTLGDGEPKYLNSPETPLFHKSKCLYGIYELSQVTRSPKRILIVEGYMDVIGLAEHDIPFAVATLGTATTEDHIRLLFRYTDECVFCFDGDSAGRAAAVRAMHTLLPIMQDAKIIRFMFLPEGDDPDSLVKRIGKEAFLQYSERALSLAEFFMDHLTESVNLNVPEGRATLLKRASDLLHAMPLTHFKQLLITELASKAKMPLSQFESALKPSQSTPPIQQQTRATMPPSTVRHAIKCLLHTPSLCQSIQTPLPEMDLPGTELLKDVFTTITQTPGITTATLLEHYRDHPMYKHLHTLSQQPLLIDEGVENEFKGCIAKLTQKSQRASIDQLMAKMKREGLSDEEKQELMQLQRGVGADSATEE